MSFFWNEPVVQAEICQKITTKNVAEVPGNFAVPWDVFSNDYISFVRVDCQKDLATFSFGTGLDNHVIWHEAYISKDGKTWSPLELTGTLADGSQKWYRASAQGKDIFSDEQFQKMNYIATYNCTNTNDGWRCGCRDSASCTGNGLWTLQKFTSDISGGTGGDGNGDDDGEGGNGVACKKEIFQERATYYESNNGPNSCSFNPSELPEYYAAIGTEQYEGSLACGACARVKGSSRTIDLQIVDHCPTASNPLCIRGHLDLNPEAFLRLGDDLNRGSMPITWEYIPCDVTGNIQYYFKPGSNADWAAVQVKNTPHPIKKFEYKDVSGSYVAVPRVSYNFFVEEDGMGVGPFDFRVTDIYGQVLESTDVIFQLGAPYQAQEQFLQCKE